MWYRRTNNIDRTETQFAEDMEQLGARWFIYGNLDLTKPINGATDLGISNPPTIASVDDIFGFNRSFERILTARRGVMWPGKLQPNPNVVADSTPMGIVPDGGFELYFLPDEGWYPVAGDLIFDVIWATPTSRNHCGTKIARLQNMIDVGVAQPRYSSENTIVFWDILGATIKFDLVAMTKALKERWEDTSGDYRRA
jgi:hypothetical protein